MCPDNAYMRLVDPDEALAWVRANPGDGDEWVGFNPLGWPAAAWILHVIYETDDLPGAMTHNDEFQIERAAGLDPRGRDGAGLDALIPGIYAIGAPLGPSRAPGSGWRRLLWTELSARLGVNPIRDDPWPGHRSFPFKSWPSNIRPPGEGTLDVQQLRRLLDHLIDISDPESECYAFFGRIPSGRTDEQTEEPLTYCGALPEVLSIYDNAQSASGPTNLWSADRSWFLYTDWDLWGTKISGSNELIDRLVADPELEAIEHCFDNR
jgi:hypothetical protein